MSICQEHPKEMLSQGFHLKLVGKGYHDQAWSIKDLHCIIWLSREFFLQDMVGSPERAR